MYCESTYDLKVAQITYSVYLRTESVIRFP